jgi:prefoldin subunit 5
MINDPNKLQILLQDTIDHLKKKEAELTTRIKPIDDKLSELSERKTKLADDWILTRTL